MQPTPRDQLPYSDADVAAATEHLRAICAALPEVRERLSHGAVTFFIRGKRVLCYLTDDHHGDGRLALICAAAPGVQQEMITLEPERFFRPPYVGHRGWIGMRLDIAPDWDEVTRVVEDAYRCVAPATLARQLAARGQTGPGQRLLRGARRSQLLAQPRLRAHLRNSGPATPLSRFADRPPTSPRPPARSEARR